MRLGRRRVSSCRVHVGDGEDSGPIISTSLPENDRPSVPDCRFRTSRTGKRNPLYLVRWRIRCQLVQRPSPAHDAQRRHARRGLPGPPSHLPLPPIRAATELASEVTVRSARCPDPRPAWPAVRTERRVRSRSQAPAECHAASRGVGHASPQRLSRWRSAPTDRSASLCYRIVNEQSPAAIAAVHLPS